MRWMPIAALIAVSVLAMPAGAQVHRCKDASGKFTYSDRACDTTHSGGVIELKKSRESILEERLQAAEANERKYRAQDAERQQRAFEQQQAQPRAVANQPAPRNLAESRECRIAKHELSLVASILTQTPKEKCWRIDAETIKTNVACGTKDPANNCAGIAAAERARPPPSPPPPHPQGITEMRCNGAACYDGNGTIYNTGGPGLLVSPGGKSCQQVGKQWLCN